MHVAIPRLPQYALTTWCSVKKVQGQLYLHLRLYKVFSVRLTRTGVSVLILYISEQRSADYLMFLFAFLKGFLSPSCSWSVCLSLLFLTTILSR